MGRKTGLAIWEERILRESKENVREDGDVLQKKKIRQLNGA